MGMTGIEIAPGRQDGDDGLALKVAPRETALHNALAVCMAHSGLGLEPEGRSEFGHSAASVV